MSNFYKTFLVVTLSLLNLYVFSQLTNTGVHINIPNGVYINAQCDIINDNIGVNNGIITNEGTIITTGHINNNGSFLSVPQSYVRLEGNIQNLQGLQAFNFGRLVIDGNGNKNLNIDAHVSDSLIFNTNKFFIHNSDLILLEDAQIKNPDNSKFVVTNGTGSLVKKSMQSASDFLFPVGDAVSSYKPVIINYTGVTDTFAVRVIDGVTPVDPTSVQKTYIIKESNPQTSTATLTLAWNSADEGTMFDPSQALMWQQQSGMWTLMPSPSGAITNTPSTDWSYQAGNIQFLSNAADSFIVKSSAPPTITVQPQDVAICENETATFIVGATGVGVITYQWQVNCTGTWIDIANGGTTPQYSGANDSILIIQNTPYTHNTCMFRCIVSTLAGNTPSDAATLTVYPLPLAYIVGDTIICQGDVDELTAYLGVTYLWSTNDTAQTIIVQPMITTNYSVTITSSHMCTNEADITVEVTPEFLVELISDLGPDNEIYPGQTITFTALPENYHNYSFYVNNVLVQTSASNVYTTSTLQNQQTVSVIASLYHCNAESDSITVRVKPIANAFTPFDKDGKNDVFGKGVELVIFNRWAQVLFIGKEGWDGTYNGKNVSPGTYYYIMTINERTTDEQKLTGSVLVISNNE